MTPAHFFFIPTIFILGFILGGLVSKKVEQRPGSSSTRAASGKPVGLAFVVFLATFFATHMFPLLGGAKALNLVLNGQRIFDQHASFSSGEVYERLVGYGPLGREMYQRFTYTADLVFPLSLLVFLALLTKFVLTRTATKGAMRKLLLGLPLVWFCADMLENTMVYALIDQFPVENTLLGNALGIVTMVKFSLLLLSLLAPALSSVLFRKDEAMITK